jgi:hypothetical protein
MKAPSHPLRPKRIRTDTAVLRAEIAEGKLVQDQLLRAIERVNNQNARLRATLASLHVHCP